MLEVEETLRFALSQVRKSLEYIIRSGNPTSTYAQSANLCSAEAPEHCDKKIDMKRTNRSSRDQVVLCSFQQNLMMLASRSHYISVVCKKVRG